MIDFVVVHQALIREWINGYAAVLCMALTSMIVVYMWDTFVEYSSATVFVKLGGVFEGRRRPLPAERDWRHAPGIPTACALFWVFAAESYRTSCVWALYQIGKAQGTNVASVFFDSTSYWSSYGYLLAGIALNGGLLRAIYIFSPPDWKRAVWKLAAVAAALFCASPTIIYHLARIYYHGF